ncbi:MAG: trimethylamine methyltransferase family protein [Desulfobacteraceae bacterium]|jgi:trimethylamine--corrinoid protein Co-methyltransferase|nr:trimethylamine methyltransferase family protein [Desulfobacteraceae bacterium]
MQFAELLNQSEVERIHEASLELFESVGLLVKNEKARRIFIHHGCRADAHSGVVKIPRTVVAEYRQAFVPTFTFMGRDPRFDKTIPDDSPVILTASSAPDIIDPGTGKLRRATSTDIANIAFLVNELPGYDVFSTSTLANDAPEGQFSLARFYPALKNCLKPIRGNTPDLNDLKQVLELGAIVAGGQEAYRERPLITHHCCAAVSPLTLDVNSTEAIIYLTERNLPCYATVAPIAGMTTPMTLLGTLALGNAEFLAVAILKQMVRPQSSNIYAALSTVADMRTGSYAPGAIETGILQMAHSQMADFYNVPSGGYIGLSGAHKNDAQAGYETGMNITAAMLGRTHMFNTGGLLSSLMVFDFAKAVVDGEMGMMLKRLKRGLDFSEENLALNVIAEAGPGGSYIELDHTFENMRDTALMPNIATRDMRSNWEEVGRLNANTRALQEASKILSRDNPAKFSDEVDTRIRKRFKGLVNGDAQWETMKAL